MQNQFRKIIEKHKMSKAIVVLLSGNVRINCIAITDKVIDCLQELEHVGAIFFVPGKRSGKCFKTVKCYLKYIS